MGLNPRVVALDTYIHWDHVTQRLPRGLVIDVPPGSPLEAAIGADRLAPLGAITPAPPPAETAAAVESTEAVTGGIEHEPARQPEPAVKPEPPAEKPKTTVKAAAEKTRPAPRNRPHRDGGTGGSHGS